MIELNEDIIFEDIKSKINIVFENKHIDKISIKEIEVAPETIDNDIRNGIKQCIHDKYSDIDIIMHFNNTTIISIQDIGIDINDVLGIKLEHSNLNNVIRVIQKNGIRYDIILFGVNSIELEKQIQKIGKQNVFIGILAIGKLMRGDYLISAHLAHMLCMNTLVNQMEIRDEEHGTNFHRYGYKENLNYLDTYMNLDNRYCIGNTYYNHIVKLIISGLENCGQISKGDLDELYTIWDFYIR